MLCQQNLDFIEEDRESTYDQSFFEKTWNSSTTIARTTKVSDEDDFFKIWDFNEDDDDEHDMYFWFLFKLHKKGQQSKNLKI